MRAVAGKRALDRTAASSGTVSRFETDILTQEQNIDARLQIARGVVVMCAGKARVR